MGIRRKLVIADALRSLLGALNHGFRSPRRRPCAVMLVEAGIQLLPCLFTLSWVCRTSGSARLGGERVTFLCLVKGK